MSFPALTWEVCDLEQNVLATLDDRREGGEVQITRHAPRTAKIDLDPSDAAVALATTLNTIIKVTVAGWTDPLFCGRVFSNSASRGDQDTVTLQAADPWRQLDKETVLIRDSDFDLVGTFGYRYYAANTDQSTLMWDLIALVAASGHGIVEGTLAGASITRDLTFPAGSRISDGVLGIADLFQGADFELAPVAASDGSLCTFNTFYPEQGTDRSATVIFKIGNEDPDLDNALILDYSETGESVVNSFTAIGEVRAHGAIGGVSYPIHAAYTAEHADSAAAYGPFEDSGTVSGVVDLAVLAAYANSIVTEQGMPGHPFTLTVDPDGPFDFAPPSEGGDYWMGDTIAVEAILLDGSTLNLTGRISDTPLTENDAGDVDLVLTCDPVGDASSVTGEDRSIVMDAGDGTVVPPPEPIQPVSYPQTVRVKSKKGGRAGTVGIGRQKR